MMIIVVKSDDKDSTQLTPRVVTAAQTLKQFHFWATRVERRIAMVMSFVIVANIRPVSRFRKVFVLSPWWWSWWWWWWWYLRFSLFWKVNPPTSVCLTHFTCLKCLPANWFGVKFHIFPGLEPPECPATEVYRFSVLKCMYQFLHQDELIAVTVFTYRCLYLWMYH